MKKMKEFIYNNYKKILVTVFMLFVFFTLYRTVPMMYDGWAGKYYYPNQGGFIQYIIYVFTGYYNWINGRIMSNIICGILESFTSEIPLDVFNTFVIVGMFVALYKAISLKKEEKDNKFVLGGLLFLSLVLLMSTEMRIDVLFYANSAYIVPVFLMVLFYILMDKVLSGKSTKATIFYMCLLGFSIGTWMEHMAFGFAAVISLISLVLFIKKNDYKWKMIIPSAVTDLGFVFMMLAPGVRRSRVVVDTNNSILGTIISHFKIHYMNIVSSNLPVFLIFSILVIILLWNYYKNNIKQSDNKNKKIVSILSFIPPTIIFITTLIEIIHLRLRIYSLDFVSYIFPVSFHQGVLTASFIMTVLIMLSLIVAIKRINNKRLVFYITMITLFSLAIMCFTPNISERVSSIGFFAFVLIDIVLFFEVDFKVPVNKILLLIVVVLITVISLDKTILMWRRINEVNVKREAIINEVVRRQSFDEWDYNKYVVLPYYHLGDIRHQGMVYEGSFHYPFFLQSSGLDPRTKVMYSNSTVHFNPYIKDDKVGVRIISNFDDSYEYKYILQYSTNGVNFVDINNSGYVKDRNYAASIEDRKGYFNYRVFIRNNRLEEELEGYYILLID